MSYNKQFFVSTLEEYISAINEISNGNTTLWYRGHTNDTYSLLPSLYRNTTVDFFDNKNYNSIHYAENIRIQQYYAKNYPFIKDNGRNTTEWIGMSQHFGMKTRFLDWSTSAIHPLVFALEQFFNFKANPNSSMPCVWVLKPQELNKKIIEDIVNNSEEMLGPFINNLSINQEQIREFINILKDFSKNKTAYKIYMESNPNNNWGHLDYIYNIAYFDKLLEIAKTNPKLAFSGHVLNPLFCFLATAYIDGDSMNLNAFKVAPLAVIHPLNSERIRSQKGVFTLFPFPDRHKYEITGNSLNYLKMESNKFVNGTLCKISLINPEKISRELKNIGVHNSWLFFEPDKICEEIENNL